MAIVRLTRREAESGRLPETCLKCGEKADHWVKKRFAWHPPWVWVLILGGILPFAIVAAILTQRAEVLAPMCFAHRRHWRIRSFVVGFGLLFLFGLVVALVVSASDRRPSNLPSILGFTLLVTTVVWLIAIFVLNLTAVRAYEITATSISLQNVSEQFADDLDRDVDEGRLAERDDSRDERRGERTRHSEIRPLAPPPPPSDDRFRE